MGVARYGNYRSGMLIGAVTLLLFVGYAAAGQCDTKHKCDFKGGQVLNDGKNTYTNSDWDCCQLCRKKHGCKSWARVAWSKDNHRKGDCWLHGDGHYEVWADNINCGRNQGGSNSCNVKSRLEYKKGITINDGKKTITGSDSECCSLCNSRSDCKYWTRTRWWNNGSLEGECWMRKSIGWENWGQDPYNSGAKE